MPRPSLADVREAAAPPGLVRALPGQVRPRGQHARSDRSGGRSDACPRAPLPRQPRGRRPCVRRAHPHDVRRLVPGLGTGLPPADRLPIILDALFSQDTDEPSGSVDSLLGASAEDPVLQGLLREMYLELEHLLDAELASSKPGADPQERRRVAYGIICLAGMHRSLADIGFPADRGPAARACAHQLVASLG